MNRGFRASHLIAALCLSIFLPSFAHADDRRDLSPEQNAVADIGVAPSDLRVSGWVDHEDRTYEIGEKVKLFVRVNQPAYVAVINVNSNGKKTVIYPTKRSGGKRISSGRPHELLNAHGEHGFEVSAPVGRELLKIVASTESIKLGKQDTASEYQELDESSENLAKDIGSPDVQGKRAVFTQIVRTVEKHEEPSPTTFRLMLRTDRPAYDIGDAMSVEVKSERDCRLTLIDIGTSGKAKVLVPSKLEPDNALQSGETREFPSDGKHGLTVKGPAGVDHLIAYCKEAGTPFEADMVSADDEVTIPDFERKDIGVAPGTEKQKLARKEVTFVVIDGN